MPHSQTLQPRPERLHQRLLLRAHASDGLLPVLRGSAGTLHRWTSSPVAGVVFGKAKLLCSSSLDPRSAQGQQNWRLYAPKNYVVAEQLLNAFHCKWHMVVFYVLKQIAQLFLILVAVVVSSVVFNDYNTIFPCPGQWDAATNRTWPLPTELSCVYSVLRSHQAAWITNYVLLGLALACTVYGLAWCSFSHGSKLNWKEAARFALESGISHNYYHSRGFFKELLRCRIFFHNHIHTDLDFLLLKLFPQDIGRAHVLRDLLIGTFVQKEVDAICQRLNLLRKSEKKLGSGWFCCIPPSPAVYHVGQCCCNPVVCWSSVSLLYTTTFGAIVMTTSEIVYFQFPVFMDN